MDRNIKEMFRKVIVHASLMSIEAGEDGNLGFAPYLS